MTNYEILGSGNKTMLVLHGWRGSSVEWLAFSESFKSKYKIILVDLPGFGGSYKPDADWGIYEYFEFIKKFLDTMNIKKSVVVGHSFGGRIGILLASRTKIVERLILIDAAGMEIKSIKSRLVLLFKPILKYLPSEIKNAFGSTDYKSAGEMRKIFVKIVNQPLREELGRIKAQTLIVWGEKDAVLALNEAEMLHQGIKGSILRIVWGGDHWPHVRHLDKLIEILQEEGV